MGMSKADRLFYILNLLRARRNMNASRLAEECGVTERSIYRDIISLSEAQVPIYYDRGYKMASDNFLPPLNLTVEEYQCLRLALDSSPLKISSSHREVVKKMFAKIEAGLSEEVKEEKTSLTSITHVDIASTQEVKKARRFYPAIELALTTEHCLELKYESISSGLTTRVVEPQFIIFRGRAFYFVAYCRLRKELRTFRMDRVISVKVSKEPSQRRSNVRPQDYFEGSWEMYKGEPVEVVVQFSGTAAKVVSSGHHHNSEIIEHIGNGTVLYRATVNGLQEIKRWILGFGDEAEVIKPEKLRKNMQALGDYFKNTYN